MPRKMLRIIKMNTISWEDSKLKLNFPEGNIKGQKKNQNLPHCKIDI